MSKANKYGIPSLKKDFPTDEACLEFIFNTLHSKECSCGGTYKLLQGRRQYQCSKCRFQIAPTAGTIFHKSATPLALWFQAILVFSNAKSGISAKQMERDLEVTYKCAWRILNLIRKALTQSNDKLKGDVEIDIGMFGGRFKSGKDNKGQKEALAKKTRVIGAIERGGNLKAQIVPDASAKTHGDFLEKHVVKGETRLMTDKTQVLNKVAVGYDRHSVHHKLQEYVRGDVHINTIEAFWSHVKRSMKGTHKVVSKKHLQSYLDAFVWHYNNRHNDRERFENLLGILLRA